MRAVITVIGKDAVGILARVANVCAENGVNVIEVTQSVLQDTFAMIMMSDISQCSVPFAEFSGKLEELGRSLGLTVHVTHEDLFNSMHRI
ncbi:MAG: ACT domain-containing protein [Acutalibacteraceae bacterium]